MQPIEKTVEQKSRERDLFWGESSSTPKHGIPRSIMPETIFSLALFVILILVFIIGDIGRY